MESINNFHNQTKLNQNTGKCISTAKINVKWRNIYEFLYMRIKINNVISLDDLCDISILPRNLIQNSNLASNISVGEIKIIPVN